MGEFPTAATSYNRGDTAARSARRYLDAPRARGYAGALAWSTNVADSATNWNAFRPVFSAWGQDNPSLIGPR